MAGPFSLGRKAVLAGAVGGAAIVAGLAVGLAHVAYPPRDSYPVIGPHTTRVHGPVRPDGTIDYAAVLNKLHGKHDRPAGMTLPLFTQPLWQFAVGRWGNTSKVIGKVWQERENSELAPWRAEQYRRFATYLHAQAAALEQATRLTAVDGVYWQASPTAQFGGASNVVVDSVGGGVGGGKTSLIFPDCFFSYGLGPTATTQFPLRVRKPQVGSTIRLGGSACRIVRVQRQGRYLLVTYTWPKRRRNGPDILGQASLVGEALVSRAMGDLGNNDVRGCEKYLLAAHHLARLIGSLHSLVTCALQDCLDQRASRGDQQLALHLPLNSHQAQRYLHELQALPKLAPLSGSIDAGDRYVALWAATTLFRGWKASRGHPLRAGSTYWGWPPHIHWNYVFTWINGICDREIAIAGMPIWSRRFARSTAALRKCVLDGPYGPPAPENRDTALQVMCEHILFSIPSAGVIGEGGTPAISHPSKDALEELPAGLPEIDYASVIQARAQAASILTRLALAVRAYRATHGHYPRSLGQACHATMLFSGGVPRNPLTGRAVVYRLTARFCLLRAQPRIRQFILDDEMRWTLRRALPGEKLAKGSPGYKTWLPMRRGLLVELPRQPSAGH